MKLAKYLSFLFLIFTFAEAAIGKFAGGEVPAWFLKQFAGSLLDLGELSLKSAFWTIAMVEALAAVLLALAVFKKRFESSALLLSQATFFALMIGERLTHQYAEAFQLFVYGFVTFFFSFILTRLEPRHVH